MFEYLKLFVEKGDKVLREKMYNVLILVGMVFVNVFLGIVYLIVYKIGGEYGILYGRVNVILLLYIICYNVKDL